MTKDIIFTNKSKNIVPLEVQEEYIRYHDTVDSKELPETTLFNESKKLFLKKTDNTEKKKLLYLLAHNGSPKAYKLLQQYQKQADKDLKTWTELCLHECAGYLGTKLLGQEETTMIMSSAGGDGQRSRYYFVFSAENFKTFSLTQKNAIKKLVNVVDKKLNSKTEQINFGINHFLLTVLLPIDFSAEIYFQEMYKICNQKRQFLRYHYFVTNVLKPTMKDIENYLKQLE